MAYEWMGQSRGNMVSSSDSLDAFAGATKMIIDRRKEWRAKGGPELANLWHERQDYDWTLAQNGYAIFIRYYENGIDFNPAPIVEADRDKMIVPNGGKHELG